MAKGVKLPFKVGDLAEARSFVLGFRGAWFRCKIKNITKRKGHIGHLLEYYDYPDEKFDWVKPYQVPHHNVGKSKDKHGELMLRPCYPLMYREKPMPDLSEISEVAVIVNDAWKVGDLVDWWKANCYWSGRITQLLSNGKAQIELEPVPLGEGSSYEVHLKDLRPSLDWSPEFGWRMPTQEEGDTSQPCARLFKPLSQVNGRLPDVDSQSAGQETEATQQTAGPSAKLPSLSSNSVAVSDETQKVAEMETRRPSSGNISSKLRDTENKSPSSEREDRKKRKRSRAGTDFGHSSAEPVAEVPDELSEDMALNSMRSDSLEAAVLDLEEYLNKVKWLKGILQTGISSADAPRSRWEFVG